MKPALRYSVKIMLFNYHNKYRVELIQKNQDFSNENPISAREEAFCFYQNWLDVLLQGIGKEYSTDSQARQDLKALLTPCRDLNLNLAEHEVYLTNAYTAGIGVYFVTDSPPEAVSINHFGHAAQEALIHGIGYSNGFNDPWSFALNLKVEFECYVRNTFDFNGFKKKASCFDNRDYIDKKFEYLETPFDWLQARNSIDENVIHFKP